MAKKPTARTEFVLFNVVYEDGTQRSNRKVPAEILGGLDGDENDSAQQAVKEGTQRLEDVLAGKSPAASPN